MEVISGDYLKEGRQASVDDYSSWCSLEINEGSLNRICLRFHLGNGIDLIFFDQLRSAVDQVGKFLRP